MIDCGGGVVKHHHWWCCVIWNFESFEWNFNELNKHLRNKTKQINGEFKIDNKNVVSFAAISVK